MTRGVPWWEWGLWVYRSVTTQANAGGGAILLDIEPAEGDQMVLAYLVATNSGTNGFLLRVYDEDNNTGGQFGTVASAATTIVRLPASGDPATTDDNVADSSFLLVRGDNLFTIQQTGAGAADDTLTLSMAWYLENNTIPTVDKSRSTNPNDVTIATPTVNKVV